MNKTPELLPCPFTGKKPDLYIYDVGDGYEGKIAVYGIDFAIYLGSRSKEEAKKELFNLWNTRVYPKDVQEAIEKQKPKKPDGGIDKYGFVIGCCKSCDAVIDGDCRYCPHCGQKQDWSDYE